MMLRLIHVVRELARELLSPKPNVAASGAGTERMFQVDLVNCYCMFPPE